MDFSQLNRQRAASFNQQKNVLKKLGKGATIFCEHCAQPLALNLATEKKQKGVVCCPKGCTHIELELA